MKNVLFVLIMFLFFGCKKEQKVDNVTAYNWVLTTAVVSPAMTINGKSETDYLAIAGEPCYKYNYTISFFENGVYAISANGPLCDMVPNSNIQKWSKSGNVITLNNGYGASTQLIPAGNNLIQTFNTTNLGVNYKIVFVYKPKSK